MASLGADTRPGKMNDIDIINDARADAIVDDETPTISLRVVGPLGASRVDPEYGCSDILDVAGRHCCLIPST